MNLQRPPHSSLHQVCALRCLSNPQMLGQASPKAWEHPEPVSTKEALQLPHEQATRLLPNDLPAQPGLLSYSVTSANQGEHSQQYLLCARYYSKHMTVLTHLIPKPHGNLLEGEKFFGPDSHMVFIPYF